MGEIAEIYVRDCFRSEATPRVKELAQRLGISRAFLTELFAAELSEAPSIWLKRAQLQEAIALMSDRGLSLTRVAYKAGFGSRRTFFRAFRREYGTSPGSVRSDDGMPLSIPPPAGQD